MYRCNESVVVTRVLLLRVCYCVTSVLLLRVYCFNEYAVYKCVVTIGCSNEYAILTSVLLQLVVVTSVLL